MLNIQHQLPLFVVISLKLTINDVTTKKADKKMKMTTQLNAFKTKISFVKKPTSHTHNTHTNTHTNTYLYIYNLFRITGY